MSYTPEMLIEHMPLVAAVAIGSMVAGLVVASGFHIKELQSSVTDLQSRVEQLEKLLSDSATAAPVGPVAPAADAAPVGPVAPAPAETPVEAVASAPMEASVRRSPRLREKRLEAYAELVPRLTKYNGTPTPEKAKMVLGRALFRRILDNVSDVEPLIQRHPEFREPIIKQCLQWNQFWWNANLMDSSAALLKVVAKEELENTCNDLQRLVDQASTAAPGRKRADEIMKLLNYMLENEHTMRIIFAAHPKFKHTMMDKCRQFRIERHYQDTTDAATKVQEMYSPYVPIAQQIR